jgi:GT2 family glycosyltransferase/glycosyltransferase involved in cell wall biosynthesis/predicted  nucleic acid-binding Zn-ribbon protein
MQIFVLGMHRSGTSVVTRLINLMGAYFGPEELSTGANPENPKGFWERRDVRDENDELLWSADADWWKVADFTVDKIPAKARKRFDTNVPQIVHEFDTHRPWVVKEPRFCLLFPMWLRLVETPICVLVHRSPVQVAHSLEHRNEFPLSVGVALWERYTLDALRASSDLPRILVSYEQIMADPVAQVDHLLDNLTNAGVEGLHRPSNAEIASFVSPELFHHQHPKEEQLGFLNSDQLALANSMASGEILDFDDVPTLSAEAERTLRLFEEVCDHPHSNGRGNGGSRPPSIERKNSRTEGKQPNNDLANARALAMAHLGESKNLQRHLDKLNVGRNALRKRAKADRREIEKLHTRLDHTEKALDRARRTSTSRARRLKTLKTDVETSAEEMAQLEDRCQDLEDALETARAERESLQGHLVELKAVLSDAKAERKSLETRSKKAEKELARASGKLDIASKEHQRAMSRIEELEPQVAKLLEMEAARDRESGRASEFERTVEHLQRELTTMRNVVATAKSRQHELEQSIEELLVFLRRAQQHFEGIASEPARRFGPLELRSQRRSAARRDRLSRLFREIGEWVSGHRDELIAMIGTAPTTSIQRHPLANDTSPSPRDTEDLSIDVIVCVHDSLAEVRRCLDSVIPTISDHHSLIIVDDGSGDETADYLSRFAKNHDHVKLIRRETAGGYTKAANCGIEYSSAEFVILLNSDTQVPTKWLKKLVRAAYQSAEIGIVGPISNAASWQSVPEIIDENGQLAVNEIPAGLTVEDMDRIAEANSPTQLPRVALANGFCFGVKRAVFDSIGLFDDESFPRGYGEENDFCFRAVDAGFGIVIATDCFVFHEKSRSYSPAVRDQLAQESGAILQKKYPAARVRRAVAECKENPVLVDIRERFKRKIRKAVASNDHAESRKMWGDLPPRILFVLPVKGGGGGVHSIVQETIGIRELGAHASVAVPGKAVHRYHRRYPNVDPSVFVGFNNVEELTFTAEKYDVVVATIFTSVKLVKKITEKVPRLVPAYYIQDYEPWICRNNESLQKEALNSYTLIPGMVRFAKTDWIRKIVEEKHGVPVHKVVPSLDTSVYFPRSDLASDTEDGRPVRIAAMVRPKTPRRAAGSTMEILGKIKEEYGESVELIVFGCDPQEKGFLALRHDFEHQHLGVLIREGVAQTLRRSDIFVDFSTYQAFGRTALEAMACGCAVIVPELGGTSEYAENEVNALVVDASDRAACVAATRRLIDDQTLRERLRKGGSSATKRYSIRGAAESILTLLADFAPKGSNETQTHF